MLQSLTVLDYLVGNGSERVIDDLREHAYQISVILISIVNIISFGDTVIAHWY